MEVGAESGDRRARRLLGLLDDLPKVISAVLLTVLVVQLGAATITATLAQRWFGGLGVTAATILLTVLLFVYGEAIPKTWAIRTPLPIALRVATPVAGLAFVLRPVVAVLVAFAELQSPRQGLPVATAVSEEELRKLAAEAASAGAIDVTDVEMIERSFDLGDLTVEQVLVPRPDVTAVSSTTTASEALNVALEAGHRRLPVHEGSLDDIAGVVRLQELARAIADGTDPRVESLAQEPLVVPESMQAVDLLRRMRESGQPFAVVIDEHGGTAGIITVDDVVAEFVGDIEAVRAARGPMRQAGRNRWLVPAGTRIDEVEARTGVSLPDRGVHTVGGLVIDEAGHIPEVGERVGLGPVSFEITRRRGQRILELDMRVDRPAMMDTP